MSFDAYGRFGNASRSTIGIDPTVDFAFKRIFGSSDSHENTIHFLNSILNKQIDAVEFLSPVIDKEHAEDKLSVLDLQVRANDLLNINVEMQTTVPFSLGERLAYYVATMYSRQLSEGMSYGELRDTVTNCVLSENLFPGSLPAHQVFQLVSQDEVLFTDAIQIHTIELAKHVPILDNWEKATDLEKWGEFLTRAALMTVPQVAETFGDPIFTHAAEIVAMIAKNPSERALYDARRKAKMDEEWVGKGSKLAIENAFIEGFKQGYRQGFRQGFEEFVKLGLEEGVKQGGWECSQLMSRIHAFQELLVENLAQLKALDSPTLRALAEPSKPDCPSNGLLLNS